METDFKASSAETPREREARVRVPADIELIEIHRGYVFYVILVWNKYM
jgi:hypothetical protein